MVRGDPSFFPPDQLSGAFTPSTAAHGAEVPSWARHARVVVVPDTPGDTVVLTVWRRYGDTGLAAWVRGASLTLNNTSGYEAVLALPKAGDHLRVVPDIAVTTLALYFDDALAAGA